MINPQIATAASTNLTKNELKLDTKPTSTQTNTKESLLSGALKKNLTANTDTRLAVSGDEDLNLKLKSLVNKVLDQLFAKSSPNDKLFRQSERLNFAPNFSNELKFLTTQMQKSDIFSEVLSKLEAILKPAGEVKADNLAPLFKNSGVFFEAKLKDALNENSLPKSFHSLLNAIKSLSSPTITAQIVELAGKDLDPKASLDELKNILNAQKSENETLLKNTNFKAILRLGEKLENFKNYISKNPNLAQSKLPQIAASILKGLQRLEAGFKQELSKPENLTLKDTSILKELNQAFNKLTQSLKALINGDKITFNQPNTPSNQALPQQNSAQRATFFDTQENTPSQKPQNSTNSANNTNANLNSSQNSALLDNESVEKGDSKSPTLNPNESKANLNDKSPTLQDFNESPTPQKPINSATNETKGENTANKPINSAVNADENETQINQNKSLQNGKINKDAPKQSTQNQMNADKIAQENAKNPQNSSDKANQNQNSSQNSALKDSQAKPSPTNLPNQSTQTSQSTQNPQLNLNQTNQNPINSPLQENLNPNEQAKFTQNQIKNLIFADEKAQMPELEALNKKLSNLARKAGESLKQLDSNAQNAKTNLNDIKNLEHKIAQASKDLSQIAPKDMSQLSDELKNDIKSTLLQASQLAKSEGNDAVANQANRLLAQIEFNQLMSLANDSINTYLPLFWEDLSESRVIFKRGKKDKYYAQIKLHFAKLGELDILIALKQDKYLDINIMAENKEFRRRIYEHSHELRRALSKAGLLSSNLFVGDIIRSKLAPANTERNYEFAMGLDKKA